MDGFRDLVGTDVAPFSKKAAVKARPVVGGEHNKNWNDHDLQGPKLLSNI